MPLLATLTTVACLGFAQQGATAQDPPLLTASEQKSLQSKLARLIQARTGYDEATSNPRQREKAQRAYEQAKEAFQQEWDNRVEKKGDLLGSVPDLEAIFANCMAYERRPGVTMRKIAAKDGIPEHCLSVPKAYKPDTPMRTVLLVSGKDDNGWTEGTKWYEATWGKKNPAEDDTIFHVPVLSAGIDLDPVPDYTSADGETRERNRIGELMQSFGETQRSYNVDRSRLFLDAGKGACAFAVRVATHFPDRFAGLILRAPTAVDDIRIGSLGGVSVLLLSSPATAATCTALKERFDAIDPSLCAIIATTDDYPFKAAAEDIVKWMGNVHRTVNHKKVVLEPNDDRFRKAFWVGIETMDSIQTAPADQKPRVVVEADREQNRVKIDAVGIENLYLQLNDALIDLDKEFTIVVNDKAITQKRTRDFNQMFEFVLQRFDCDFLFPVQFRVQVPKADAHATEAGGAK